MHTDKPAAVSVHIVTYNSAEDIGSCLEAVLAQTYPIAAIVVVDNASADDSLRRAALIKERMLERDNPVPAQAPAWVLLANSANAGFAPAHNQAMAATASEYALVLNPDVVLAPDYIARLVQRMEADRSLGSATGLLVRKSDPATADSAGLTMNGIRRAFDRGAGQPAAQWSESGYVFGVSGAAALYSRRMVEDIAIEGQFFDADFFAYKEDVDVAWRAQLYGWKSWFDAGASALHERGWKEEGRSAKPLVIRRHSFINRYRMLLQNEPARSLPWTLLKSLPYEAAVHGYLLLKEPRVPAAWGQLLRDLKPLLHKRRIIQGQAKRRRSHSPATD